MRKDVRDVAGCGVGGGGERSASGGSVHAAEVPAAVLHNGR